MKKLVVAIAATAGIALQSVAFAGAVFSVPVTVGTNIAYGSLKYVRYSGNTRESFSCGLYGATNQGSATTYVSCSAVDAAGRSFGCSTYSPSPQLVQAALAISDSSYVIAQSDANYNCTYIYVNNSSGYM